MLCGLPGSGKSHEAEILAKEHDATICSSDKLQKELLGDVDDQRKNAQIFDILQQNIRFYLQKNQNVIFDATNINSAHRRHFLKEVLKTTPCEKIAIIMATPYQQCLANNQLRERKVPEEVIKRMYMNWQTPYYFEGFDLIQIVLWDGDYTTPGDYIRAVMNFDQQNSHHNETLGNHLITTAFHVNSGNKDLFLAAALHDCGKPFTKKFCNGKGEPTEDAHYYQHANVGAYDSFFYTSMLPADSLLVSWLINNHMDLYQCDENPRIADKRKRIWGDVLYEMVMKLHKADKDSH